MFIHTYLHIYTHSVGSANSVANKAYARGLRSSAASFLAQFLLAQELFPATEATDLLEETQEFGATGLLPFFPAWRSVPQHNFGSEIREIPSVGALRDYCMEQSNASYRMEQSNASSSAVAVANPSGQALMCAAVLATSVPLIEVRDEEMDGKAASLSVYGEPSTETSTYIHTFCRHTVYLSLVCIYIYPISSCTMQHKKTKSIRGLVAVSIRCVCRPTGSKPSSSQA